MENRPNISALVSDRYQREDRQVIEIDYQARPAPNPESYCGYPEVKCYVTLARCAHQFFNHHGIPYSDEERVNQNLGNEGKDLHNPDCFKMFCTTTIGKRFSRITVMAPSMTNLNQAEVILKRAFAEKFRNTDYFFRPILISHCSYCFKQNHDPENCPNCYFCSLPGHRVKNCHAWMRDRERNFTPHGSGFIFHGLPPE